VIGCDILPFFKGLDHIGERFRARLENALSLPIWADF